MKQHCIVPHLQNKLKAQININKQAIVYKFTPELVKNPFALNFKGEKQQWKLEPR